MILKRMSLKSISESRHCWCSTNNFIVIWLLPNSISSKNKRWPQWLVTYWDGVCASVNHVSTNQACSYDHSIQGMYKDNFATKSSWRLQKIQTSIEIIYIYTKYIRWKLPAFHKVQWLQFTGKVYKFITIQLDISSKFCLPEITKIHSFLTGLLLNNSRCPHCFLLNMAYIKCAVTRCFWSFSASLLSSLSFALSWRRSSLLRCRSSPVFSRPPSSSFLSLDRRERSRSSLLWHHRSHTYLKNQNVSCAHWNHPHSCST